MQKYYIVQQSEFRLLQPVDNIAPHSKYCDPPYVADAVTNLTLVLPANAITILPD